MLDHSLKNSAPISSESLTLEHRGQPELDFIIRQLVIKAVEALRAQTGEAALVEAKKPGHIVEIILAQTGDSKGVETERDSMILPGRFVEVRGTDFRFRTFDHNAGTQMSDSMTRIFGSSEIDWGSIGEEKRDRLYRVAPGLSVKERPNRIFPFIQIAKIEKPVMGRALEVLRRIKQSFEKIDAQARVTWRGNGDDGTNLATPIEFKRGKVMEIPGMENLETLESIMERVRAQMESLAKA